jgi:SIR2-like domain
MPDADGRLREHWELVVGELLAGRVVPFLGAGANLCGRPNALAWEGTQSEWLPNGAELSVHLARTFTGRHKNEEDLVRVSQYVALMLGAFPLYQELRALFDRDYPPTSLHRFLAELPSILRSQGAVSPYQLIVTTNYDDVLERAFREAGEPFDLVTYDAEGPNRARFIHHHEGESTRILEPNNYADLTTNDRTVILKIHGAVDRVDIERDSYVITEDHYIDYLARGDISRLIPVTLVEILRRSHCLFLGYGLRDWHLRVILNRIWGEERLRSTSWAVQRTPDPVEERLWIKRQVEILDVSLEDYVVGLREALLAPANT